MLRKSHPKSKISRIHQGKAFGDFYENTNTVLQVLPCGEYYFVESVLKADYDGLVFDDTPKQNIINIQSPEPQQIQEPSPRPEEQPPKAEIPILKIWYKTDVGLESEECRMTNEALGEYRKKFIDTHLKHDKTFSVNYYAAMDNSEAIVSIVQGEWNTPYAKLTIE